MRERLQALDGARVGGRRLRVELEGDRPPWSLRLFAARRDREALALSGQVDPGGRWRRPWIEARVEAGDEAERATLFARLGDALPAGAYVMLDVSASVETLRALAFGVPPACTREGWLLWRMGARWFKVWDFPEGGREGGEKIQGNLPLDAHGARAGEREIRARVDEFLRSPMSERSPACARRARELAASPISA